MTAHPPAGWFPDPFGRFEHRFWDGFRWTEHVGANGTQMLDSPTVPPPAPFATAERRGSKAPEVPTNKRAQRQIQKLGLGSPNDNGGGTLFSERVLVVHQKAKLIEKRVEYAIFDQLGRPMGQVRQLGSAMAGLVASSNSTKRFQISDAGGNTLLTLTKPTTIVKSRVSVMRGDGTHVGHIVQDNLGLLASALGGRFNDRFRMEADGEVVGTINAEDWRAWNFNIQDANGTEIARVTKTRAGLAREAFTKADHYVLEIHRGLEDPLLSLVVSAAVTLDVVLKPQGEAPRQRRR